MLLQQQIVNHESVRRLAAGSGIDMGIEDEDEFAIEGGARDEAEDQFDMIIGTLEDIIMGTWQCCHAAFRAQFQR
eukprot:SAG11_NODE_1435_length_4914_cov_10.282866_3_plen_75_part_00